MVLQDVSMEDRLYMAGVVSVLEAHKITPDKIAFTIPSGVDDGQPVFYQGIPLIDLPKHTKMSRVIYEAKKILSEA